MHVSIWTLILLCYVNVLCLFLSVLLNESDLSPVISKSPSTARFVSRVTMLLEVVGKWWMKAIDYGNLVTGSGENSDESDLWCSIFFFLFFQFNDCFIAEKCSITFLILLALAQFRWTFCHWEGCHRLGIIVLNARAVRPESFIWHC